MALAAVRTQFYMTSDVYQTARVVCARCVRASVRLRADLFLRARAPSACGRRESALLCSNACRSAAALSKVRCAPRACRRTSGAAKAPRSVVGKVKSLLPTRLILIVDACGARRQAGERAQVRRHKADTHREMTPGFCSTGRVCFLTKFIHYEE